jgi:hypothetical protein
MTMCLEVVDPMIMIMDRNARTGLAYLPLGARITIGVEPMPELPLQIGSMQDARLRQHAADAWTTTWQLKAVLVLWTQFHMFQTLRVSLDRKSQLAGASCDKAPPEPDRF